MSLVTMAPTETGRIVPEHAPFNRMGSQPGNASSDLVEAVQNWLPTQPVPIEVGNALVATFWLARVEGFREEEEKYLLSGEYASKLEDHRVVLTDLIAKGEAIIWGAKKNGMVATPLNFTIEDLQATLESLHRTFRAEHGPKNSRRTDELIAQLFDGSKS